MTTPVLFVHGAGPGSHTADRVLAEHLQQDLGPGYAVDCPALPDEDDPDYAVWKAFLLDRLSRSARPTVAVGHSVGGSVLAKLLTEARPGVCALVLLSAPFWRREGFWRWDDVALPNDAGTRLDPHMPILVYHGDADTTVPVAHLDSHGALLGKAVCRVLPGRDHQLGEDMSEIADGIRALRLQA